MIEFKIACGDWIYPAKDSSTRVQYPIDWPVVAEIFLPSSEVGKQVSQQGGISHHLRGPRYLEVSVDELLNKIKIEALKNKSEELFVQRIDFELRFDPTALTRSRGVPSGGSSDYNALFFSDVLLQAHIGGKPLPEQIVFRKASMPEVESLGRW